MAHRFVWYDLMTTDTDAALRFYAAVLGWEGRDSSLGDGSYSLLFAGDAPAAGLLAIPDDKYQAGLRPCWSGYIGVTDVDEAAARIVAEGGAIHHPGTDIRGVGRFAVVADPQGAVFVLFNGAPTGQAPEIPPGAPGHVGWHELHTKDGATAFDFYARHFGWTRTDTFDMGPMGLYQMFSTGEHPVGGMMTRADPSSPPHWAFYVNVPDIEEAASRVREAGGQVLRGPMEVPGGEWILHALDPQGAFFALVAPAR